MKTPGKHGRPRECRSAVRAAGRLCADPGPACFHRERLCPCGSQPCRSAGQRDSGRRGAFLIPGACWAYRRALWSSERESGGPPEAAGLGEAPVTEGATVTRLSPLRASRAHSRTRRRGAGTHAPSASGLARADCENAPGRTSLTSVHGHLGPCPHLCKTPGGRASWESSCGIVFKIRVFGAFLQNGSPKSRSEQQPTSEPFLTDTTSWVHGAAGRTRREGSALPA